MLRGARGGAEALVRDGVQQQAVGGGKGDHEIAAGDLVVEIVHLAQRQTPQQVAPLPCLPQDRFVGNLWRRWVSRVQAGGQAARPAIGDRCRQQIAGGHAAPRQNDPGTRQAILRGKQHAALPI